VKEYFIIENERDLVDPPDAAINRLTSARRLPVFIELAATQASPENPDGLIECTLTQLDGVPCDQKSGQKNNEIQEVFSSNVIRITHQRSSICGIEDEPILSPQRTVLTSTSTPLYHHNFYPISSDYSTYTPQNLHYSPQIPSPPCIIHSSGSTFPLYNSRHVAVSPISVAASSSSFSPLALSCNSHHSSSYSLKS
jgi:hypothetical protein